MYQFSPADLCQFTVAGDSSRTSKALDVASLNAALFSLLPFAMGGFASSRILEVHGERMLKRTFDPGFRIELHQKDLNLALQGAKVLGLSLPNTAAVQELMNACAAHDMGGLDHSALCRAVELMGNCEIRNG